MATTPSETTKTKGLTSEMIAPAVVDTTPITITNAAPKVSIDSEDNSPAGAAVLPKGILAPLWWDPHGPPNQKPPEESPQVVDAQTPPKTVLPKGYDPKTGLTPLGAEGWQVDNIRCNTDRPGVPGHTRKRPFCVATPERDQ